MPAKKTYPTAPGLLPPPILALYENATVDGEGNVVLGNTNTTTTGTNTNNLDLSAYITTNELGQILQNYVTTNAFSTALNNLPSPVSSSPDVVFITGYDNFNIVATAADLNKIYVIRSTAGQNETATRIVNLLIDGFVEGNGNILIVNASQYAPLSVRSKWSMVRENTPGMTDYTQYEWLYINQSVINVGKWANWHRVDKNSSNHNLNFTTAPSNLWGQNAAMYYVTFST